MEEIINCIFSFNYKNIKIKKIVDFLIQEEGQLKIIELLLHLDNIKNDKNKSKFQEKFFNSSEEENDKNKSLASTNNYISRRISSLSNSKSLSETMTLSK